MAKKLFTVGQPKSGGRKAGSKNKSTQEIRDAIQKVVSKKMDELESDLQTMSPFQQWQILDKVAKYFIPALSKSDDTVEHSGEMNINISYGELGDLDDTGDTI